jgi:hypothetical protein
MRKSQSTIKDDYFYWKYVTIEDMVKYYLDRRRYQRADDDLINRYLNSRTKDSTKESTKEIKGKNKLNMEKTVP